MMTLILQSLAIGILLALPIPSYWAGYAKARQEDLERRILNNEPR